MVTITAVDECKHDRSILKMASNINGNAFWQTWKLENRRRKIHAHMHKTHLIICIYTQTQTQAQAHFSPHIRECRMCASCLYQTYDCDEYDKMIESLE